MQDARNWQPSRTPWDVAFDSALGDLLEVGGVTSLRDLGPDDHPLASRKCSAAGTEDVAENDEAGSVHDSVVHQLDTHADSYLGVCPAACLFKEVCACACACLR